MWGNNNALNIKELQGLGAICGANRAILYLLLILINYYINYCRKKIKFLNFFFERKSRILMKKEKSSAKKEKGMNELRMKN